MTLNNILVLDTETTGVEVDRHRVVEVGVVLWSVTHRSAMVSFSTILQLPEHEQNEAEFVNGVPEPMLKKPDVQGATLDRLVKLPQTLANQADAIVAHNAEFDRGFCKPLWPAMMDLPWICTMNDFTWPKQAPGSSLTVIALAHGHAVVAAHRALTDCMLLVRLFESIDDIGERLEAALAYSQEPKLLVRANPPYSQNSLAKNAGFRWSSNPKGWIKRCTRAEYEAMKKGAPFPLTVLT